MVTTTMDVEEVMVMVASIETMENMATITSKQAHHLTAARHHMIALLLM